MNGREINRVTSKVWVLVGICLILLLGASAAGAEEAPPADPRLRTSFYREGVHPSDDEGWELSGPAAEDLPSVVAPDAGPTFINPSTSVVINEIDEWDDEIELYNKSGSPVDMTGWVLKNYKYQDYFYTSYTFPPHFILEAGAYVVIHQYGDPASDSATDLYTGSDLYLIVNGGALALLSETDAGVDFVRWGVNITPPPFPVGWVGVNPIMSDTGLTLGRDPSSTDTDHGEDWFLQFATLNAQNTTCFPLPISVAGSGSYTVAPTQSPGCPAEAFTLGEEIVITAIPAGGWEVGQWAEYPATQQLGTDLTLKITMQLERDVVLLSFIQSIPDPGTVLLIGWPDPYDLALSNLGIPYDQMLGSTYAPDWDVLNRYDLVIYQGYEYPSLLIQNQRVTNYSTFLDEGNCMWVGTNTYAYPDSTVPNILASHFGVAGWVSWQKTAKISGRNSLFEGYGPYTYPLAENSKTISPTYDAEIAFRGDDSEVLGVSKYSRDFISTYITFDPFFLQISEVEEMLERMADQCLTPANDDFDNATVIPSMNYRKAQRGLQIRQSTTAGDDPILFDGEQREYTVWYSYTPLATVDMTVTTFGSNFDTVLGVWTGPRGGLTSVVVNDNAPGTEQSKVAFTANAGTTYHIEVGSYWFAEYGRLVLNTYQSPLFEDNFETGDFSLWSRFNDGNGDLYPCHAAGINGAWGACVDRGSDKRKQLIDETPVNQTAFSVRVGLDPNGLSMAVGERFRFLQVKMLDQRPFFLVWKYQGGKYWIQLNTMLDDLTKVKTGWYVLSNAPNVVEVDWLAATGPGTNDGSAALYINDGLKETLSSLDNDTIYVDTLKIGFTSRLDGKIISGTFYLDDVATSNKGYGGLP